MGESSKAVWAAVCMTALTAWIAYVLMPPARRLPVYQGKTLYQWIAVLNQAAGVHPAKFQEVSTAQAAIRAIGTNALPFALADLHARVTVADDVTAWLAHHAPFLKLHPKSVSARWALGTQTLDILGPIAKPCLPELIAEATNNPGYSEEAMLAVGAAALPAFTNLLRASQFPEREILIRAFAQTVRDGQLSRTEAAAVLPLLTEASRSTDRAEARAAIAAMSAIQE